MIEYQVTCDHCRQPVLTITEDGRISVVAVHAKERHETRVPRGELLTVLLRTVGKDALIADIDVLDRALRGM
jgi:hypothetical protein